MYLSLGLLVECLILNFQDLVLQDLESLLILRLVIGEHFLDNLNALLEDFPLLQLISIDSVLDMVPFVGQELDPLARGGVQILV